jgi:hypothetical protein
VGIEQFCLVLLPMAMAAQRASVDNSIVDSLFTPRRSFVVFFNVLSFQVVTGSGTYGRHKFLHAETIGTLFSSHVVDELLVPFSLVDLRIGLQIPG